MSLLLLKLILTPLLIGLVTLASRRWGSTVAGWLVGLPLTSGPVSIFLCLEQGRAFAAQAASGMLLGLIPVAAFCLAYARTAPKNRWPGSLSAGLGAYFIAAWGMSKVNIGLAGEIALVSTLLGLAFWLCGRPQKTELPPPAPRWDLPLRMASATALVMLLTTAAPWLGAHLSGLIAPFPAFALVMSVFAHHAAGGAAAHRVSRGVTIGMYAAASFYVLVVLGVEHVNLLVIYLLAACAAMGVNMLTLRTFLREPQ
jgi:hypothetical protein